jgi:hypothetical protein
MTEEQQATKRGQKILSDIMSSPLEKAFALATMDPNTIVVNNSNQDAANIAGIAPLLPDPTASYDLLNTVVLHDKQKESKNNEQTTTDNRSINSGRKSKKGVQPKPRVKRNRETKEGHGGRIQG